MCICSTSFASGSAMHFVFSSSSTILMTSTSCILPIVPCFSLKYCVCYIHEQFNRLLQVLKKDSVVSHDNCDCTCPFCVAGNCRCVFTSDMDLYWFTRHMMCTPSKLHSKTSRNLFPPRCIPFIYFLSLLLYTNATFLVLSCFICLDGRCSAESPCFFGRTDTIFQCPKSRLFSDDPITFEQCVNEDVTASAYASDPLLHARDSVPLYGVLMPPPKRIKWIWKKVTTSKRDFAKRIFELAPDTFEHHQVGVHIWLHILLVFLLIHSHCSFTQLELVLLLLFASLMSFTWR